MGREVGKVKWFNDRKGFGFIVDSAGQDVFVHYSSIRKLENSKKWRTLDEGVEVEFDCVQTEKGKKAFDVIVK